ncbi:hypothetical protein F5Y13DRAFT_205209 [Hypoxylon sp. FL1857]|nr:hypothetical protein F5Y13DRAFT_205209 [Hypoxylon sp. FL1857]
MGGERDIEPTMTSSECQAGEVDTRPDTSPYTGPHATLHFKDGPPLSVPTALLSKYPKLSSRCEADLSLHLGDIPGDSGHVLVHHILAGMYQCLKPKGSSASEKCAAEFATSLAKAEIERLGRNLQATQLLDTIMDAHPILRSDDIWFHDYLKSVVKSLIKSPPVTLKNGTLEHSSRTVSLASILLKSIIELWREKKDAIQQGPNHLTTGLRREIPTMALPKAEPVPSPRPVDLANPALASNLDAGEASKGKYKEDENKKAKVENPPAVDSDPPPVEEAGPTEQMEKQRGKRSDNAFLSDSPLHHISSDVGKQAGQHQNPSFRNNPPEASPFGGINSTSAPTPTSTNRNSLFDNQAGHSAPYLFETSSIAKASNVDNNYLEKVPFTLEAMMYYELRQNDYSQDIDRFLHICVQPKFAGFSPEELRLKHQHALG